MVHDARILDLLDQCEKTALSEIVFRVTPKDTNAVAPSLRGGRWMIPNQTAVLYTSRSEDGAIAEISFNYMRYDPPPRRLVLLHEIAVSTMKTARITRTQLEAFGLNESQLLQEGLQGTQRIGAAAAFLEFDSLLVPSLRWETENLVIFADNHGFDTNLKVLKSREVDWMQWQEIHTRPHSR